MRKALRRVKNERMTFTGVFVRFGTKRGYKGPEPTLLLQNITFEDGSPATEHLWFNLTKGFAALELQPGDIVQFDARVQEYEKGYKGRRDDWEIYYNNPVRKDYKLSRPTKLSVIGKTEITIDEN